jgi:hypothetical protein
VGRPPEVDHVKREFLKQVDAAVALVDAIKNIPSRTKNIDGLGLHPKHLNQAVGLAFMGLVSSWEEFIERSLVRYVAGAQSSSGFSPKPKVGIADDIGDAYIRLTQDVDYDPQKKYLKTSDPKWIHKTGAFFFSKNPFICIKSKIELLEDANCIRNRVAHESIKCKTDFKKVAVKFLNIKNDRLTQGFSAGQLLLKTVERHFGQTSIDKKQSHFIAYASLYRSLAKEIIP